MSSGGEKFVGGARGPGPFARSLLAEWRRRRWPVRGERAVVAVSGGADSTALLLALEELKGAGLLGVELTAAHLNHGLRGGSAEEDARFAESLARECGFEFVSGRADVGARAVDSGDNLEQAARGARYEFLSEAARRAGAAAVLTGHTLDDQAETVLLRLLRGSGSEGLGGMRPERSLEAGGRVSLRRPLLEWARRADTEGYCRARGVGFRADEMNEDERFARVRVRRRLLPLLETFNPRAALTIARAAGLLREESSALEGFAARLLEDARAEGGDGSNAADAARDSEAWPLRVEVLNGAPSALRRRALRLWVARGRGGLRRISLANVAAVERLLKGERGGRVAELPGGAGVERRKGLLTFYIEGGR
ncbi:MAG TPA: tRNA lysidine(34) synthetase TilS [Pyrinomonadaceae bacterium]|nr:tRNA lysidine(34) synthetase TilS [Pyrinomonadaceae bacterium]